EVLDRGPAFETGIVDEHVTAAERLDRALYEILDRFLVGDVGGENERLGPVVGFEGRCEFFQSLLAAGGEHNTCSIIRERVGGLSPDTRTRTGDDRGLPVEGLIRCHMKSWLSAGFALSGGS